MNENDTLYLSSEGRYTIFEFRDTRIKMISPKCLERYAEITDFKPDIGYIAVMTKYSFDDSLVEEYIDMLSTLDELLIDRDSFLNPIKNIEIRYAGKNIVDSDYNADISPNGYVVTTLENGYIRVLNLSTNMASVFLNDSTLVETNMDDKELNIARSIFDKQKFNNYKFLN